MERLFVDTSAWLAFINRTDTSHDAVAASLRSYQGRLVTSMHVLDETVTLARRRLTHSAALLAGEAIMGGDIADLTRTTPADEREALRLFADRADKLLSYTDCTSLVLMRRLGIDTAATLDAEFVREGFQVLPGLPT